MDVEIVTNVIREFPEYCHVFNKSKAHIARKLSEDTGLEFSIMDGEFANLCILGNPSNEKFTHIDCEKSSFPAIGVFLLNDSWSFETCVGITGEFLDIGELAKGYICDKLYKLISCYYGHDWPLIYKNFKIIVFSSNGGESIQPIFKNKL